MFEFISEVLTNIANFFKTAWDFVISFFKEIVYIIQLLAGVVVNMPSYFTWLPSVVTTLLLTGISIIVVYKVIGRD